MTGTADAARANRRATIVDHEALRDTFREDVLEGLAREQKTIWPKHLYDKRGSELFEQITELPEYYPTRTEAKIFDAMLDELAADIGPGAVLIEPGSGSCEKAERMLATMESARAYVPIEISRSAVDASADALAARFPDVVIAPMCADFTRRVELPEDLPEGRRVVFFPGSTLGNFDPTTRHRLLAKFAAMARAGGLVLVGADLEKDPAVLRRAYNDAQGVTAAFNLNLLTRINRELEGTFKLELFEHDAPWVPEKSHVEMRLVALEAHEVRVCGETFAFRKGEWIHTENSTKFTPARLDAEAKAAGLLPVDAWTDDREWLRVSLYGADG